MGTSELADPAADPPPTFNFSPKIFAMRLSVYFPCDTSANLKPSSFVTV